MSSIAFVVRIVILSLITNRLRFVRKIMIQKVISFMEKHNMILESDLVAAGVSGGADSLCLLFVLLEYKKKIPFDLVVVHVNHGLRQEAALEAEFVKEICDNRNIPFFLKETDVKKIAQKEHLSEEEAGRKVRYSAFEEALKLYQKDRSKEGECKIAVAHHQNDVAETVMFHMFRGTGIYGMSGILPVNNNIIRPLLSVSRREIEDFLTSRGQSWCIDYTNEEDTYTRNKIRHHILGYADREINERATEHVAKAAAQMASMRQYLETEVSKIMERAVVVSNDGMSVDIAELKKYPELLQGQLILTVINTVSPGRKDVGSKHVQDILELLEKSGSKKIDLPGSLEAVKEYETLWIKKQNNCNPEDKGVYTEGTKDLPDEIQELESGKSYFLKDGSVLEIFLIDAVDFKGIEENKYTKYFDYDRINHCLTLRFRQSGDYMTINDREQKKTLKEYFINEKIPASIRSEIPLIADGNHILWAIGYRISTYYKVTPETRKIVQMIIRRNEHGREN